MTDKEIAGFLETEDRLSYADIIDALLREEGETLFFAPEAGIVFRHFSGVFYIASTGPDEASLLGNLPREGLCDVHSSGIAAYMMERMAYKGSEETYLFSYSGDILIDASCPIRPLDNSFIGFVMEHYDTSSAEDIKAAFSSAHIYGAFSPDGDLMGFAGFHEEGSMGMLTVLPEYRRRGIGEALERHLISTALSEGRVPFCNVYASNSASIALQGKLGLMRGEIPSWWIWTE